MTRAIVSFVGALGFALPLWALGSYPADDGFSRFLVAVVLGGFLVGVVELFRRARSLDALLVELPASDAALASSSSAELRRLIDARLRGERAPIARAGAMTPYLISALVLVGLLGTFVGLVDTVVGARLALGASADVGELRSALLAPMRGLSRAFGTSVAGISASALLGLASVLVRRAENKIAFALDALVAGPLADRSLAARQLAALERLGKVSEALPAAIESIAAVGARLPALERTLCEGQRELAVSLARSVDEAAAALTGSLARGLETAARAHDDMAERAVERAAAVLERRAEALARRFEDEAARRAEAERALHGALSEKTREVLDGFAKAVEERSARASERDERLTFLIERAAEVADAAAAGAVDQAGALRGFLVEVKEQERALGAELRSFLERQRQADDALVGEVRALIDHKRASDAALIDEMRAFIEHHRDGVRGVGESVQASVERWLDGAGQRIADGTSSLVAGGMELTSLADRFALAVDAFGDATRTQLDRLSQLEVSLSSGGADRERERFGAYLDQTREVFERSLELQRELFVGLRALSPARASEVEALEADALLDDERMVRQPGASA